MTAIPLTTAGKLAGIGRRTAALRLALALIVAGSAVAAIGVARHPHSMSSPALGPRGHDRRPRPLGEYLDRYLFADRRDALSLAHSNGEARPRPLLRSGLCSVAQGTPPPICTRSSGCSPRRRWPSRLRAHAPAESVDGDLQRRHADLGRLDARAQIAVSARGPRPKVVLISDLSDDPRDLQPPRLGVVRLPPRPVPVRIVGLDPEPSDLALFQRPLHLRPRVTPPRRAGDPPRARAAVPVAIALPRSARRAVALHARRGRRGRLGTRLTGRIVIGATLLGRSSWSVLPPSTCARRGPRPRNGDIALRWLACPCIVGPRMRRRGPRRARCSTTDDDLPVRRLCELDRRSRAHLRLDNASPVPRPARAPAQDALTASSRAATHDAPRRRARCSAS